VTEVMRDAPLPPSLWAATATPAPHTPPLGESADADVAVIGAGFTGLSTALHLAERGVRVCVLDAAQPGWGASGRNGGQVIPGFKYDPDELVERFGDKVGERLVEVVGGAADTVFDVIARYGIDCQPVRAGWIQVATSRDMLKTAERRARQWAARGAKVALLDAAEVAGRLGARGYLGGWIDERAGSVQPLSYARGLARAALQLGVRIHGATPVRGLTRDGDRWQLATAGGPVVRARQVVIATNGYSGALWPGLRETVIAANSFIVATKPLGAAGDAIMRGGEVASDARRLLLYFRRDAAGRLLVGGRGPFREPRSARDWAHLERSIALLYPQLKDVQYDYRWAGRVAITADFLPHVHEPAPGVSIVLGYNGRGVAMATTLGKLLAQRLCSGDASEPFPLPATPVRPIPLHGLQRLYITAGVAWYRLLDKLG
jgi:glycine/D-amino acid oxidase-like deaminating enzyme